MRILHYDQRHKAAIIAQALEALLGGGTVVYPTETAYALGADFYSPEAYRSVFSIKSRMAEKPLPVIVPDFQYATTLVEFTPEASRLAQLHWPGPLTLVLPFRYHQDWPHHPDSHLALRVSSHPLASDLSKALGRPLVSTSANVSGQDPCYDIGAMVRQMKQNKLKPDLVIDVGVIPETPPSTIVKIDQRGMQVLRQGALTL